LPRAIISALCLKPELLLLMPYLPASFATLRLLRQPLLDDRRPEHSAGASIILRFITPSARLSPSRRLDMPILPSYRRLITTVFAFFFAICRQRYAAQDVIITSRAIIGQDVYIIIIY